MGHSPQKAGNLRCPWLGDHWAESQWHSRKPQGLRVAQQPADASLMQCSAFLGHIHLEKSWSRQLTCPYKIHFFLVAATWPMPVLKHVIRNKCAKSVPMGPIVVPQTSLFTQIYNFKVLQLPLMHPRMPSSALGSPQFTGSFAEDAQKGIRARSIRSSKPGARRILAVPGCWGWYPWVPSWWFLRIGVAMGSPKSSNIEIF